MNTYIQIKAPSVLIQINENDNSVQLKGNTAGGYINQSILKDDPELNTKVTEMVEDMENHQREQLVNFCGEQAPALDDFDHQISVLKEDLDSFLEKDA